MPPFRVSKTQDLLQLANNFLGAANVATNIGGPGSNPRPGVISGIRQLLVVILTLKVSHWVFGFSALHKNQHF